MIVLAGDVGGTNARLASVELNGGGARILHQRVYRSRDYTALAPLVRGFCRELPSIPRRACFGLAGPVVDQECTATNLPWTVAVGTLGEEIGIPATTLTNDLVAVGHGLELLGAADLATLQAGVPVPRGPIGVIGVGTGLGQGLVFWAGDRRLVLPSEGGHADFAPDGRLQTDLLEYLWRRLDHVSWERVLSGAGLVEMYRFLALTQGPEHPAVQAEAELEDPASVITRHGLARTDPLSEQAVNLFCRTLGAQAGNLALAIVATGGVYLAGGIAPRLLDRLRNGQFLAAFTRKGRMCRLLSRIPVHVIMNPNVGLLGAAALAAGDQQPTDEL